jgi:hypothetical protein
MNQNNYMTYMVTYVTSQTNNLHHPQKVIANARIDKRRRIRLRGELCVKNPAFLSKIACGEHPLFVLRRLTAIAQKNYRPCAPK